MISEWAKRYLSPDRAKSFALGGAILVAVGALSYAMGRAPAEVPLKIEPLAEGTSSGRSAERAPSGTPSRMLVHIAGEVRKPGVYSLPKDARLQDALRLAGGARVSAATERLNLAAPLQDGEKVVIPKRETLVATGPGVPAGAPIGELGELPPLEIVPARLSGALPAALPDAFPAPSAKRRSKRSSGKRSSGASSEARRAPVVASEPKERPRAVDGLEDATIPRNEVPPRRKVPHWKDDVSRKGRPPLSIIVKNLRPDILGVKAARSSAFSPVTERDPIGATFSNSSRLVGRTREERPLSRASISLNSAGIEELDRLPGIGPATAGNIIAERRRRGGFRSLSDLLDVPGLGPAKVARIRPYVTL